jgi:hypothetical protein
LGSYQERSSRNVKKGWNKIKMDYSFLTKIKMLFCKIFGHRAYTGWGSGNVMWYSCRRCNMVYSKPLDSVSRHSIYKEG